MSRPLADTPSAPSNGPNAARAKLLTADELAARWQVPKSQVYRLTREDQIPAVRLGKYYRYRLDAIERFETGSGTAADAVSVGLRAVEPVEASMSRTVAREAA